MSTPSLFDRYKQKAATQAQRILNEVKNSSKKFEKDERFWRQTVDAAGNGKAILRFLPAHPDEDLPYVKLWTHSFKGPHGWYINNSLTTLEQNDPLSEWNSKLWATGTQMYKDMASKQKRRLSYIANVLVVRDYGNPANNGKVMLYKFGTKIHEKMVEKMQPKFEGEEAINPFDLENGCNFTLKIKKQQDFPNYDDSTFGEASALCDGDVLKINQVLGQLHKLQPFIDPSAFKSYDELTKQLIRAVGADAPLIDFLLPKGTTRPAVPAPSQAVSQQATSNRSTEPVDDEDEPIQPADTENIDDYLKSLDGGDN
jgi:hypothetical protein